MRNLLISFIIFGFIGFAVFSFGTETGKAAEHQQNTNSVQQIFKGEVVEISNVIKLKAEDFSYTLKGHIPSEMTGKKVQITGKVSEDRTTIYVTKIEVLR